jgi:hypothetical protein
MHEKKILRQRKKFICKEIIVRDKSSLDITWLKKPGGIGELYNDHGIVECETINKNENHSRIILPFAWQR